MLRLIKIYVGSCVDPFCATLPQRSAQAVALSKQIRKEGNVRLTWEQVDELLKQVELRMEKARDTWDKALKGEMP